MPQLTALPRPPSWIKGVLLLKGGEGTGREREGREKGSRRGRKGKGRRGKRRGKGEGSDGMGHLPHGRLQTLAALRIIG